MEIVSVVLQVYLDFNSVHWIHKPVLNAFSADIRGHTYFGK
jgi:hypothetical protein